MRTTIFKALLMNSTVRRPFVTMVKRVLTWDIVTACIVERTMRIPIVAVINDIIRRKFVPPASIGVSFFFDMVSFFFDNLYKLKFFDPELTLVAA